MKVYNYIKGEMCCWRCGMTKYDVRLSGHQCYTGYGSTYPTHIWQMKKEEGEQLFSKKKK